MSPDELSEPKVPNGHHEGGADDKSAAAQAGQAKSDQGAPPVSRPDPEDPPAASAQELDDDFDPAAEPSNPDLVGPSADEPAESDS